VTKKVVGVFVRFRKDHAEISLVANVGNFLMIRDILLTKEIDVLILDLELEGLSSIFYQINFEKIFQRQKILFSGLSEQIYAPNAIKAGVSGFVHKKKN
jgi:DNA-binding NarL/FixJ family response regulator